MTDKKILSYTNFLGNTLHFEIVTEVPEGYSIWNIGKNMIDGYLPLCKLKDEQPFDGAMEVDTESLKAIEIPEAQEILAAVGGGTDTLDKMEKYVKQGQVAWIVERVKKVLPLVRSVYPK